MKKRTVFFAMLVMLSSMAFAVDKPGMTVLSVKGSEIFKVIYKGSTESRVKLNIFNSQGKMIHSESITGLDGFIRPLNFKGLPSGDYTIELVDKAGKHQEVVTFRPASELKTIHMSRVPKSEGKVLLAISNVQNEPMNIRVFDANQRMIHEENKTIKGDFAQVYKLENAGRCTFEVSDAAGHRKYFYF